MAPGLLGGGDQGLASVANGAVVEAAGHSDGDIGCARVVRSISSLLPSGIGLVLAMHRSPLVTYIVADERGSSGRCLEDDGGSRGGGETLLVVGVTIGSATPRCLSSNC